MIPAHTIRGLALLCAFGCARASAPAVPAPLVAPGPVPLLALAVSEISLQRSGCFFTAPCYGVTLHRDGTAEYRGYGNVRMLGLYRATVDSATFMSLAAYMVRRNVWSLRGDYGPALEESDAAETTTTVVTSGDTLVIHRLDQYGPPVLNEVEGAVDVVVDHLRWIKAR